MKFVIVIAVLLIGGIVMAGEKCCKPCDTTMYYTKIDTVAFAKVRGCWKPVVDTTWCKKIPVYLTPDEIKTLMGLLHPQYLWNGIADTIQSLIWRGTPYIGSSISDSTVKRGELK